MLDFLFLVGNLEELGFNGNSAETALINCGGKTELVRAHVCVYMHSCTCTFIILLSTMLPAPPLPLLPRALQAVDYLKEVMRYKEMGYKEKGIHEAYQKSDKDWDKALDILLQQH